VRNARSSTPGVRPLLALAGLLFTACPGGEESDAGFDSGPAEGVIARDAGQYPDFDGGRAQPADGGEPDSGPGRCPPDDSFEDNDTRSDATPLTSEVQALSCGGDDDWYDVEATSGCLVTARIRSESGLGDVDVTLYGPSGTLLDADNSVSQDKSVSATATSDGRYAVRIRSAAGTAIDYRVSIAASCAAELSCPADDGYEQNDTPETASVVEEDEQVVAIVCSESDPADTNSTDEDHYRLNGAPGCMVEADLRFSDEAGDLDLRFIRPDGSDGARSLSVTDNEHAVEMLGPEGYVTARVYGLGTAENTYRFQLSRTCASDLTCPADDPFEPNDERTAAQTLYDPVEIIGRTFANDDFYRVTLTTGCTASIAATFTDADGDLDLRLVGSDDGVLASSVSTTDDESIEYVVASGGNHWIRVNALANAENTYRLSVSETCPP
jgi:hypothetical protein